MKQSLHPHRVSPAHAACGASALLFLGLLLRPPAIHADAPRLGPALYEGFTYEHSLSPGEVYQFPVEMREGEYLRAEVDQFGIDLVVRLVDDAGQEIAQADSMAPEPTLEEREQLAALAPSSGRFVLRIEAAPAGATGAARPARFRLAVHGPRPPLAPDLDFRSAVELLHQASVTYFTAFNGGDPTLYTAAARVFDQASPVFRALRESRSLAYCLFWAGVAKHRLTEGDWKTAAVQIGEAATIFRSEGGGASSPQLESTLLFLAAVQTQLGDWENALRNAEEALPIARAVEDKVGLSNLHAISGRALAGLGRFAEADRNLRTAFQQCEALPNPVDCPPDEGSKILLSMAGNYTDWGRYQEALATYGTIDRRLLESSGVLLRGTLANNLGELYGRLGDHSRALEQYRKAAVSYHRLGDTRREAIALTNLAASHRFLGKVQEAQRIYDEGLSLPGLSAEGRSILLYGLAYLYILDLGQFQRGVDMATESLAKAGSFPLQEARARHALALGLQKLKKSEQARTELNTALAAMRGLKERVLEAETLLTLARVDRDEGKYEASRDHALAAVNLVESMREGVKFNQSLRASFLAFRQAQYEFYVDTLMTLHELRPKDGFLEQAFDGSETARARTLLENLQRVPTRTGQSLAGPERDHLRQISLRIGEAQVERQQALEGAGPASPQAEATLTRIEGLLLDYETTLGSLQQTESPIAFSASAKPLPLQRLRSEALDGDVVLLEYGLGTERSYLWVVTSRELQAFKLPGRAEIEPLARQFYDLLTARNRRSPGEDREQFRLRVQESDRNLQAIGRRLSQILLTPASTFLQKQPATILVVSDGALHFLPFAALPAPGKDRPLISETRVVHLPSASTLAALREREDSRSPSSKTLGLFAAPAYRKAGAPLSRLGLPTLPWSQREAESISALLPREQSLVATGWKASRKALEAMDLAQFRILHFGVHGFVDSDRPELSSLAFSLVDEQGKAEDGYLRLVDIYSLHLNADLVTLSACRTALGKEIRGEGLVGLARGFMAVGAQRVVGSLWSVEDRATAELMTAFYKGMLTTHLAPSEALRQAQLEMLKDPRRSSPYYWAAFTLQGEWR
jgi:CHAT domain-containing protein/tetratricopeptide (TPR) repeat protein